MSNWGFVLSRRWAGYLVLVVVFAVACSALGVWQLNRRAEAQAEIARINSNYDAAPVAVGKVLPNLTGFNINDRWKVVALSGKYLVDDEVLVRNRPMNGVTGYEVITPFLLVDGTVFMVDRGWLPGVPGKPDAVRKNLAAPPAGDITITARLKPGEGTIAGRISRGDELATIDLNELAQRVKLPSYIGAYGLLIKTSVDANPYPTAFPRPPLDEGPHLSYAFQWFVFGVMAFIALGWAANRERKGLLADAADAGEAAEAPSVSAKKLTPTGRRQDRDADIEDEILERSLVVER